MTFDVIIPTLNRPKILKETLDSIAEQSIQPEEIIIIDQSEDTSTKELCEQYKNVNYIYTEIKSSSIARNLGIEKANSEILFFLDDDVELMEDYFKVIIETYREKDVIAVQGWIKNIMNFSRMGNLFRKIFLFEYDSDEKKMLPNFIGTNFKKKPTKNQNIQWCNGCGFSVKSEIAKIEKFEQHFFLYSLAEDRDFSYRALKHGKVILNPNAEMIHKVVNISRLPTEKKTRMTYVHQMYLISKNLGWTFKTSFCYWWNIFGRLLIKTISLIKLQKESLIDLKNNWHSLLYVLKHKKKIIELNVEEFNKWLFRNKN